MIDDTPCAFNIAKEKIGKKKPQKKGLFSKQIKDYQNDSPLELLITNHYENQWNNEKRAPSCLGYIGEYTTQLGDYN